VSSLNQGKKRLPEEKNRVDCDKHQCGGLGFLLMDFRNYFIANNVWHFEIGCLVRKGICNG
jgi:hypothetical protein